MTGVAVTTLPNGVRVVTDSMPHVETVSLGVWVRAGTRDETADVNGIAHLLEHMAFKGTARRSARAIAEEIEAVGGHLNAYTSRENTAYYARVLKADVGLALDIISDILLHSTFDPGELAREREVVLQEIGQAHDTPDDIVFDHFQEAAYPDQPMGWPTLGRPEIVAKLSREALTGYMADTYGAEHLVVAAAGRVDHEPFVRMVEDQLGSVPPAGDRPDDVARYVGGEYREDRDLEQAHLVLGLPGLSSLDEDYYALGLFSTMLGGGMSSRLFQEVREKRGLVYSIYSFHSGYRDSGVFGIYAGTGPSQLAELVDVTAGEFTGLADDPGADELSRAKAQAKASVLMSLESTGARAEQIAGQMLVFGRPIPMDEMITKIDRVGRDDIARVANRLAEGRLTVASIGPVAELPSFDDLAARFG